MPGRRGRRGGSKGLSGFALTEYLDSETAGREQRGREWEASQQQTWSKYSSSNDADTGQAQTDYYEGTVGESNQKKKVHIAIDDDGEVIYVRDMNANVLYDRKMGIGSLPPNLDWSE